MNRQPQKKDEMKQEHKDDYYYRDEDGLPGGGKSTVKTLARAFFPVTILAFLIHTIQFRILKYRLKYSIPFSVAVGSVIAGVFIATGHYKKFYDFDGEYSWWGNLIEPLLWVVVGLSFFVAAILTWYENQVLKKCPWMVNQQGNWFTNFEFNDAPWEKVAQKNVVKKLKSGELLTKEATPLGISLETKKTVCRYAEEAFLHTLITGAAGSGKTVTMLQLQKGDIRNNRTIVTVDFKASSDFSMKLAAWAKEEGMNFYHFTAGKTNNRATYDPFAGGGINSKADRLLALREWTAASDVYKADMDFVTKALVTAIHYGYVGYDFSLSEQENRRNGIMFSEEEAKIVDLSAPLIPLIDKLLDGYNLGLLLRAVKAPLPSNHPKANDPAIASARVHAAENLERLFNAIKDKRDSGLKNQAEHLRSKLRTITSSDYGPYLYPQSGMGHINMSKITSEPGNVILFSISSNEEPEFAKFMGSLIMADISTVSSARFNSDTKQNSVSIYADEFQSINPETITPMLEKGREARMAVTLGLQSLEQLIAYSAQNGEAFVKGIVDTCSNFIVHAGGSHSSSERMSDIAGTERVPGYVAREQPSNFMTWFKLIRPNNNFSTEMVDEWKYSPSFFMGHSMPSPSNGFKATATILKKNDHSPRPVRSTGATAERVWMIPESEVVRSVREVRDELGL